MSVHRPDDDASRRLLLLDALVLVAATAAGMAGTRAFVSTLHSMAAGSAVISLSPTLWLKAGTPCLAAWTLGLVFLRLERPRPRLRRIACQPGAAACLAASATVLARFLMAILSLPASPRGSSPFYGAVIGSSFLPGPAVVAVWLNLALGGRWRPERSWIDRAGRVLGVAWFASFIIGSLPF